MLFFLPAQTDLKSLRNLFWYLRFESRDVGKTSGVVVTPNPSVVPAINEFQTDGKTVRTLCHPTGEDSLNAKCFTNFLRIDLLSLIAENGCAGHDAKIRQSRKIVDDALSNPVCQILQTLIACCIHEWHNGK